MGLRSWVRNTSTGLFASKADEAADPAGTVRETYGDANVRMEIKVSAEAVILGAGYPVDGRVEVNQVDLDRLKEAIGFKDGQP